MHIVLSEFKNHHKTHRKKYALHAIIDSHYKMGLANL